jgi:hypothetical protein
MCPVRVHEGLLMTLEAVTSGEAVFAVLTPFRLGAPRILEEMWLARPHVIHSLERTVVVVQALDMVLRIPLELHRGLQGWQSNSHPIGVMCVDVPSTEIRTIHP